MPQSPDWRLVTETRLGQLGGTPGGDLSGYVTDAEFANQLQLKEDKTTIAAATHLATPSSLARRDTTGRIRAAAPTLVDEVATKGYADALGVVAATPSTVVRRDTVGRFQTVDPAVGADVATKAYTDTKIAQSAAASFALKSESVGVVIHGTNANAPRLPGYAAIRWIGSIAPVNAVALTDDWLDTSGT